MKIIDKLEKSKPFWFLLFTGFIFFILRLPSFFEPLWYGDEGIYQVIGTALNNGRLLYSQTFDNKPPLLYWIYAAFQSDQFTIRLFSAIVGVFTVIIFFFLSKKLFRNKNNNFIPYLTTSIFTLLFGLPMLEGNIANAENFMLLPIICSAYFIVSQKKFFIAGLLLGIAFLIKIVAVFDLASFIVFYFILNKNSLKKEIKLLSIVKGFLLPLFLTSLFFLFNGTFLDFAKATFISNISYVSYGNKIGNFPSLLFIKLILLGGFVLFALFKRKKFNTTTLFISIWFAFSLFNAFFSQRPYTHYLLVLIPSLSLAVGLILFDKTYRKIITVAFLIAFLIILKGFGIPKLNKNINYYQNFIAYIIGTKTLNSYQAFFDRNTPLDYEVARFLKPILIKNDTIFLWGNNAQLYQLAGVVAQTKYVVAYHIVNYKDGITTTGKEIEKTRPKFIVVMPNVRPIPFPLINYFQKINIKNILIYERTF